MNSLALQASNLAHPDEERPLMSDRDLVLAWLRRFPSVRTQEAYRHNALAFLAFLQRRYGDGGCPLSRVSLDDLQSFGEEIRAQGYAENSRRQILATIRSLFAFCASAEPRRFPRNLAELVPIPERRNRLAERILSQGEVKRLVYGETDPRNHAFLLFLYASGLRVSEAVGVRGRDLRDREGGRVQVTVTGKGRRTRTILLPAEVARVLQPLRQSAGEEGPLFPSRKGGHLSDVQAWRIVKAAAARAGIRGEVSPHWLRHACGTHMLEGGAIIHEVSAQLGHASLATTSLYLHANPDACPADRLGLG